MNKRLYYEIKLTFKIFLFFVALCKRVKSTRNGKTFIHKYIDNVYSNSIPRFLLKINSEKKNTTTTTKQPINIPPTVKILNFSGISFRRGKKFLSQTSF